MKVLFVCTGNTCRSPMAEAFLNKLSRDNSLEYEASSAGIFAVEGGISENSIRALDELGIDISNYKSKPITDNMIESADIVLTMSLSHKEYLDNFHPQHSGKIKLLNDYAYGIKEDIKDPYGGDLQAYKAARDEIFKAINKLIEEEL